MHGLGAGSCLAFRLCVLGMVGLVESRTGYAVDYSLHIAACQG